MRAVKVFAIVAAAVLLLGFLGMIQYWDSGAFCAKCGQDATIYSWRVCFVPVYWRTDLGEGVDRYFLVTDVEASDCDPKAYEHIHGTACRHEFIRGGGGRNTWWAHFDTASPVRRAHLPRLGAITGLYRAYGAAGDVEMARMVYEMIDCAYPAQGYDYHDMLDAGKIFRFAVGDPARHPELLKEAEFYDELGVPVVPTALTLAELTMRLREVETADDFRQVLDAFKPRLQPAPVAE